MMCPRPPQRPEVHLEISGLRWRSTSEHIASRAVLRFRLGEICALMGPSGAGKSSLLKAALGWTSDLIADARVNVAGQSLADEEVMLMPQDSDDLLLPWYSVRRNWQLAADAAERSLSKLEQRAWADALGLDDNDVDAPPLELSGGQQRRAALGMVLIRGARLLLLDEPFGGLDPDIRARVLALLHRIVRNRRSHDACHINSRVDSILLTAHSIDDVALLCDRVFVCQQLANDLDIQSVTRPAVLDTIDPDQLFFGHIAVPEFYEWQTRIRTLLRPMKG